MLTQVMLDCSRSFEGASEDLGPAPALHTAVKNPKADWYLYRRHKAARICGTACPCKCRPPASRTVPKRRAPGDARAGKEAKNAGGNKAH